MTVRQPIRPILSKTLNPRQQISALALKVMGTNSGDQLLLENIQLLARLGARASLIQELTGAKKKLVEGYIYREGRVEAGNGRRASSITNLMANAEMHLEAGKFLRHYQSILRYYPDAKADMIHAEAFIRALMLTRGAMPSMALTPDHALMIANLHHAGGIALVECRERDANNRSCGVSFIRSTTLLQIRHTATHGDCPMCRIVESERKSATRQRTVVDDVFGGLKDEPVEQAPQVHALDLPPPTAAQRAQPRLTLAL